VNRLPALFIGFNYKVVVFPEKKSICQKSINFRNSTVGTNLTCRAYGVPVPRLVWTYNNKVNIIP